jgi:hypothetical protein
VPLSNFVPRGFGFVHHSIAILYHEVPNPNITIRNFLIAVCTPGAGWHGGTRLARWHLRVGYHTEAASLFIRIPKDANNALRLMLYAQFAGENETNQQVLKYWGDGRETRQADLLYIGEKMRKKQEELLRPLLVRHPCSHHHHPAM